MGDEAVVGGALGVGLGLGDGMALGETLGEEEGLGEGREPVADPQELSRLTMNSAASNLRMAPSSSGRSTEDRADGPFLYGPVAGRLPRCHRDELGRLIRRRIPSDIKDAWTDAAPRAKMAREEFGRRQLPFLEKHWCEAEVAEVWFGVEACPEQRDSGAGSECLDGYVGLPPRGNSD